MMQHNQGVHTAWRHCSGSTKVDQIKKHKQALFSQPDVLCHLTHEKKYKRPKIKKCLWSTSAQVRRNKLTQSLHSIHYPEGEVR